MVLNRGPAGLFVDDVFFLKCRFKSGSYKCVSLFFLVQISIFSSKSMFQKMVLKRGLTGLLSNDVFFFNFSSLIGVLLVCLLSAGRPVDANRRETLMQRDTLRV